MGVAVNVLLLGVIVLVLTDDGGEGEDDDVAAGESTATQVDEDPDSSGPASEGYASEATRAAFMEQCEPIQETAGDDTLCDCVYGDISQNVPFEDYQELMASIESGDGGGGNDWWVYAAFDTCGGLPEITIPPAPPGSS